MIFGYARISTKYQKFDLQINSLLKCNIDIKNIYKDIASGVREERKELDSLLMKLREEDTVIVWKLDRIARSVIHLAKLMEIFDEKGVQFKSIQEPFLDTTSSHGKFVFTLFSAVAQLEGDLIIDRTKAGFTAAALRGIKGGRRTGQLGLADFIINHLFINFQEYNIFPILMVPTIKIKTEHHAKLPDKGRIYSFFKKSTKNSIFICYF